MARGDRARAAGAGRVRVVRAAARLLAVALALLVLAFLVGEGVAFDRLRPVEWLGMGAIAGLCAGYLLGWRHEIAGGVLVLAALAVVCGIERVANDRWPGGLLWPWLGVPGALYLVVGIAARRAARRALTSAAAGDRAPGA